MIIRNCYVVIILFFVMILFETILSYDIFKPYIIGGDFCGDKTDHPYDAVGALVRKRDNGKLELGCSVVLINPLVALTAAHCLKKITFNNSYIYMGSNINDFQSNIRGNEQLMPISNIYIKNNNVDLGVIYLLKPVLLKAYPQLANIDNHLGRTLKVIGFGVEDIGFIKGRKNEISFKLADRDCDKQILKLTGNGMTGVGKGDSGAPVFLEEGGIFSLVGIISGRLFPSSVNWGQGAIAVYLAPFIDWIHNASVTTKVLIRLPVHG